MNSIFNFFIKSDFVKAQILAFARHAVTTVGAGLVVHGYASQGMIESASGLVCMALSFYLSQRDVVSVDTKITTALATPLPTQAVSTTTVVTSPDPAVSAILHTESPQGLTPDQEKEETNLLNKLQAIRPGVVK